MKDINVEQAMNTLSEVQVMNKNVDLSQSQHESLKQVNMID